MTGELDIGSTDANDLDREWVEGAWTADLRLERRNGLLDETTLDRGLDCWESFMATLDSFKGDGGRWRGTGENAPCLGEGREVSSGEKVEFRGEKTWVLGFKLTSDSDLPALLRSKNLGKGVSLVNGDVVMGEAGVLSSSSPFA